jgi:hypothetical protein
MENNRSISIGIIIIVAIIFGAIYYFQKPDAQTPDQLANNTTETSSTEQSPTAVTPKETTKLETPELFAPIDNASNRITKKPFGIKIDPKTSPVQPERFSGYHTGTDFEATPEEATSDVKVYALCSGKLLQKRTASGYGGFAVQECTINNQVVTVIYGHINISSVTTKTGELISTGQQFAILANQGTGTDGERKHLHLGIHKGSTVNIKGYVQTESELNGWMDYETLGIK